jgi:hypothetical protein
VYLVAVTGMLSEFIVFLRITKISHKFVILNLLI